MQISILTLLRHRLFTFHKPTLMFNMLASCRRSIKGSSRYNRSLVSAGIPALGALVLWAASAALPAAAAVPEHWIAAWATAQQSVADNPEAPGFNRAPNIAGRTVRQIVQAGRSGDVWRVRVSNRYGRTPVVIIAATLGQAGKGAALAGAAQKVLFAGSGRITLAPGDVKESDPIHIGMSAGPVAVSIAVGNMAPPTTWHKLASQVSYASAAGDHADHTADVSATAFKSTFTSWVLIDALSMQADEHARVVAAIGDSITDGMRSSLNMNRRWPDALGRRLNATAGGSNVVVDNLGISGNRLLSDSFCYGEKLAARFQYDALGLAASRYVIVLIGINDINFAAMPPHKGLDCDSPHTIVRGTDLIRGYQKLIESAHQAHRLIYGATLTPADLPADREAIRSDVNHWIRTSGAFDAVIDFDQALRDPQHPTRLLSRYDSGDHIHPSDAGYAAMADAIPLTLFQR